VFTRGRLSALGSVKIRFWPVALAGLAFQMLLFSSPLGAAVGDLGLPLYVGSTGVVLLALVFNLRQPGFWLIFIGAVANFIAIVANGGQMPASAEAWAALNGATGLPTVELSNVFIASPQTPFYFLGDLFVLPRPFPLANVFSIGDALIGLGGAWFVVAVMHGRGVVDTKPSLVSPRKTPTTPTRTATQA
jgi:hypothetical protein